MNENQLGVIIVCAAALMIERLYSPKSIGYVGKAAISIGTYTIVESILSAILPKPEVTLVGSGPLETRFIIENNAELKERQAYLQP